MTFFDRTSSDVYDDMNLYITPDKFYIEPRGSHELLIIDRVTQTLNIHSQAGQIPVSSSCRAFCGFLGTIPLLSGHYLVLATAREHVGYIAGNSIWRLAAFELIPYSKSTLHLTMDQLADEKSYISMIEQVLNTPYHYFSYTYDLSHTMQRLYSTPPEFLKMSLMERADQRFVWNAHILNTFNRPEVQKFCLPLIHGFVSINQCAIAGHPFTWTIVSRRSTQRAGTRLFCRGVDQQGHVANFVETEQIVELGGDRASFVQTRGSIPLVWSQTPDLRYKPPPRMLDEEQITVCAKHFESQVLYYGRQIIVNLVDQRGAEGALEKAYAATVQSIGNSAVRYEAFDFHAECKKMRWDRLSILIARLAHEQDELGCFLMTRDGALGSLQDGVFRTNCIDCLDRTNVVQSMLARRSLNAVLQKLGILRAEQSIEDHPSMESLFKQVWADNADLISIQYSGTGALKTDFTRTGKRTYIGLLRDGMNSMTRYYKNNFADGYRQDAINFFLGCYCLRSPLRVERGWKYVTFPTVLMVAVAMFVACATLPSEYSTEVLLFMLFWGSMIFATTTTILRHGPEFVDWPRLSN